MPRDDRGYIVVETAGAFIPFIMLVVAILSIVNIVTAQVRIHHALTQTAAAVSMYCYVLEATGIAQGLATMDEKAGEFAGTIDSVIDGINLLTGTMPGGTSDTPADIFDDSMEGLAQLTGTAGDIADDPEGFLKNFLNFGLNGLKDTLMPYFIKPLLDGYLSSNTMTADEYLRRMKISNLKITQCTIIDSGGNIMLTAEYDVAYTFGMIRLPSSMVLHISQTAATKAWLGGSGSGYG